MQVDLQSFHRGLSDRPIRGERPSKNNGRSCRLVALHRNLAMFHRIIRVALILAGLSWGLATLPRTSAQTLEEAEKQLQEAFAKLQSYTARLRETNDLPLSGGDYMKSETTGSVVWKRKGDLILYRMEIEGTTTQRHGGKETKVTQTSTLVSDGELFYTLGEQLGQKLFIKQRRDSSIDGDLRSMMKQVEASSNVKRLADEKLDGDDCCVFEIIPRQQPEDADPIHRTVAWFRKDLGINVRVATFNKDGKETFSHRLLDIKLNEPIDAARFVLKPPPDAEIRDLTSLDDKPALPGKTP